MVREETTKILAWIYGLGVFFLVSLLSTCSTPAMAPAFI